MIPLSDIPMANILLQQPPFRFADRLLDVDESFVRSAYTIPETGYFVQDGRFSAAGVAEHIAQTCAARIGYIARYIRHESPQPGFLGQIRRYTLYAEPRCGQTLITDVHITEEVFGITLATARVQTEDGQLIAEATLKTALPTHA